MNDAADMRARLLGTWSLLSYDIREEDGNSFQPFGPDPVGLIHYGPDRFMCAHIMVRGRQPTGEDVACLTGELATRMLVEHFSYCGTFEVRGNQVIHDVSISISPDWIGTKQVRYVRFDQDRLIITAAEVESEGHAGAATLEWQRALS